MSGRLRFHWDQKNSSNGTRKSILKISVGMNFASAADSNVRLMLLVYRTDTGAYLESWEQMAIASPAFGQKNAKIHNKNAF